MSIIQITNHGPLITWTDYWHSDTERAGKFFVSPNAGAIRLLVPIVHRAAIEDMRTASYAILSRGPWPEMRAAEGVEIMFEDHTDSPFALHLTADSFAMLPAEPEPDREWTLTVWDWKKHKPHKAVERPCRWRRVEEIPCLKPWGQ